MEKNKIITPFKMCVIQKFPFIEADFDALTNYELLCKVVEYLNKTIEQQNISSENVNYLLNWFDNLDLQDEVNNKLDEMAQDGTLDAIIGRYIDKMPRGNDLALQRIGRKILYGELPTSTTYNANGNACTIQGGCVISNNLVAYALWDSVNTELNKNRIVVMDINTGVIQRYADYSFGWCNSLAYNDGKLYIAERGKRSNNQDVNNGIIHILDANTLIEESSIDLNINVNAISIYENEIYALEENTTMIKVYDLDGIYQNKFVYLNVNIANTYNQDIKVTDKYIYLLSSRPNNLLNVFDKLGNTVESYNVNAYGGLYFVGELQFIDTLDTNLLIGSVVVNYNEFNNQFFKVNPINNISVEDFVTIYGNTIYCNSEINSYNPDGSQLKPFETITEASNTNIKNLILECNNKDYPYSYLSNHKYIRIQNAKLVEGANVQYGTYVFENCNIDKSIVSDMNACIFFRNVEIFFINDTFDAKNGEYCFYPNYTNIIKFSTPTFLNYTNQVCRTNAPNSIIHMNNLTNIPYIPRVNDLEYDLTPTSLTAWKTGSVDYTTTLSSDEIKTIIDNCSKVIIECESINTATIKSFILNKTSNNNYTISDSITSSSSINLRVAKMILTINENGINITSSNVTKIISNDGSSATFTITQADSSSTRTDFLTIKKIKFKS